jgi:hypothetical protein
MVQIEIYKHCDWDSEVNYNLYRNIILTIYTK